MKEKSKFGEKFGPFQSFRPYKPVVSKSSDRMKSIKENTPAVFIVREKKSPLSAEKRTRLDAIKNNIFDAFTDMRTVDLAGRSAIYKHDKAILKYSEKYNLDPDIARSVMYAENAKGWYGIPGDVVGQSKTPLPMNVRKSLWSDLIEKNTKNMYDADANIETGVLLLKRIRDRVDKPTPEKIGTLYNSLSKDNVTAYGEYVGKVYKEKPWKRLD